MVKTLGRYIVADPAVCHGKPTFVGTRILVSDILEQVANGLAWETIVGDWRGDVSKEAIAEAVRLARDTLLAHERELYEGRGRSTGRCRRYPSSCGTSPSLDSTGHSCYRDPLRATAIHQAAHPIPHSKPASGRAERAMKYRWHRQTISETFERIGRESSPWVPIGDFLDDWCRSDRDDRLELVSMDIASAGSDQEMQRWAAFCAAMVEWLCWQDHLPFPAWTNREEFGWPSPGSCIRAICCAPGSWPRLLLHSRCATSSAAVGF